MHTWADNPERNALPANISDDLLAEAIDKSGFPLQTRVADTLRGCMQWVEEEWAYLDSDSGGPRTLDIAARRLLTRPDLRTNNVNVDPALLMLVECKQSSQPYVFFLLNRPDVHLIPQISGLQRDRMLVHIQDEDAEIDIPIGSALSLNRHAFCRDEAPVARSVSRSEWVSKKLTLNSSEAHKIILPLTKAADHVRRTGASRHKGANYFVADLVILVAVLDAPMVGVSMNDGRRTLNLLPWVRLMRSAPDVYGTAPEARTLGIDFVHVDYLDVYVRENLLPFATSFAEAVARHQIELDSCRASVSSLHGKPLEGLLRPVTPREEPSTAEVVRDADEHSK